VCDVCAPTLVSWDRSPSHSRAASRVKCQAHTSWAATVALTLRTRLLLWRLATRTFQCGLPVVWPCRPVQVVASLRRKTWVACLWEMLHLGWAPRAPRLLQFLTTRIRYHQNPQPHSPLPPLYPFLNRWVVIPCAPSFLLLTHCDWSSFLCFVTH
jgi:hypothetical protein